MKRSVLLALSALMAGAMSLPAGAAGTNEKTPDSAATGATGTGSNAMSGSAADRTNGAGSNVSGSASSSTNSATGASATDTNSAADSDTHVKKSKRKARHMKKAPDAARNHGAVGGESGGKSSDSPSQ